MLIDTDSTKGLMYDACEKKVHFLNRIWIEIDSAKALPNSKFKMIARAGIFHFYANTDPSDNDNRGYCIIGWSDT